MMEFTMDELAMLKAGLAAQMRELRRQGETEGNPHKYGQQATEYWLLADKIEAEQLSRMEHQ